MRKAVSITLEADNLLWLRAQADATPNRSLSGVLDRLVTEARKGGRGEPSAVRSVVGTIDLPDDDPALDGADAAVRAIFAESARQALLVRERPAAARRRRRG